MILHPASHDTHAGVRLKIEPVIEEVSNGETALKLVDKSKFDLTFMDQYMASTDKQLLGTETVQAL
jgi:DNA-binding NarL/FixJ family response regulator